MRDASGAPEAELASAVRSLSSTRSNPRHCYSCTEHSLSHTQAATSTASSTNTRAKLASRETDPAS